MSPTGPVLPFLAPLALATMAGAAHAQVTFTLIRPGNADGCVGANGQAAFSAPISGENPSTAYVLAGAQSVVRVLSLFDPAPGTPTGVFFIPIPGGVLANPTGQVLLSPRLGGPGVTSANQTGLWLYGGGAVNYVARLGDQAPGTPPGVVFAAIVGAPSLGNTGVVAFAATLAGPGVTQNNYTGLWAGAPGALDLLARAGDPVPGLPGVTYSSLTGYGPTLVNPAGQVCFGAGLSTSQTASFISDATGVHLVVRAGDSAPGTGGLTFAGTQVTDLNGAGQVLVRGTLTGTPPSSALGLWTGAPGSLQLLMRAGDQAAGMPPGVVYGIMTAVVPPLLGNDGAATFVASLFGPGVDSTNDVALFSGPPGAIAPIIRKGDQAPGFPAGTPLNLREPHNPGYSLYLAAGVDRAAFIADVPGAGAAVFAMTPQRTLVKVAAAGDAVQVAPGDTRTVADIDSLSATGSSADGSRALFRDDGSLFVHLRFTDGSASVVLANVAGQVCYPNCDGSTTPPILSVNDFICFLSRFAAGDSYANCDLSTTPPALNVRDFICFLNQFAAGCN